jgi:hypothetical protein
MLGKGRDLLGTAGAVRGMSPTSAAFRRRFRARTSLFASNVVPGGSRGRRGSYRGGKRKEPVDLCHLATSKTALLVAALSSFFLKKDSFA